MSPSTVRFWEQADVVLELIGFLDVRDAIALICTCSGLHALLNTRTLWLILLRSLESCGYRLPRPALSPNVNECSFSTLRDLVIKSITLERTWAADFALPRAHSQHTLPPGFAYWTGVLKGSDLAYIFNDTTNELACMNLAHDSGACSTAVRVEGIDGLHTSTCQDAHTLLIMTRRESECLLRVYALRLVDAMPVLEQIWSKSAPLDIKDGLVDYFMEGSAVNFVEVANNIIHIRTWDISTAAHHSFGLAISILDPEYTSFTAQKSYFHVAVTDAIGAHVFHITRPSLADKNPSCSFVTTELRTELNLRDWAMVCMSHGLVETNTIEIRQVARAEEPTHLAILYRPYRFEPSIASTEAPPAVVVQFPGMDMLFDEAGGTELFSFHHRGVLSLCIKIDDDSEWGERVLRLVVFPSPDNCDFSQGGPKYTICDIICPPTINLSEIRDIALDSALGIIYLQEGPDMLHSLMFL